MPPVLYITLGELTACGKKKVLAHEARLGVDERHYVLKLIAKTEGAPGLVVAAPRPQAACQRLVQKPAVSEHVEGLVRCFHVHGAERVLPVLPDRFERVTRGGSSPEATHQVAGILRVPPDAESEDDFTFLPSSQFKGNLNRGARV